MQLYNFPPTSANGQTVGILSPSGGFGGYLQSDLDLHFGGSMPTVTPISADGTLNGSSQADTTAAAATGVTVLMFASTPDGLPVGSAVFAPALQVADQSDLAVASVTATTVTLNEPLTAVLPAGTTVFFNRDFETTQDLCIAATAAPGADVAVFFCDGSQTGWVKMIGKAMAPDPGDPFCPVISSSFYILNGDDTAVSSSTTKDFVNAVSAAFEDATNHFGITICIASGDTGTDSKVGDGKAHVQYPATDPNVLAVGGTTLGKISATATAFVEYV